MTYQILTRPKPGSAADEYAQLSLNIYKGCTHGCKYCYCPPILRKLRDQFHGDPDPKADIENRLQRDCDRLAKTGNNDRILLSFVGDPYQETESTMGLTRKALEILNVWRRPFCALTKNPALALRDLDLFLSGNSELGISLISMDPIFLAHWEPGAPGPESRLEALRGFHDAGVKTWISLEPVIQPDHALTVIQQAAGIADIIKVGKINHDAKLEAAADWKQFRQDAEAMLKETGTEYVFKNSL